jgi:hypothetical protein
MVAAVGVGEKMRALPWLKYCWPSIPMQELRRHARLPAPSPSMPAQELRPQVQWSATTLMANVKSSVVGSLPSGPATRVAGHGRCLPSVHADASISQIWGTDTSGRMDRVFVAPLECARAVRQSVRTEKDNPELFGSAH